MGSPPDIPQETASLYRVFRGMDQRESTPPNRKSDAENSAEVSRILELLRGGWKHGKPKQAELGVYEAIIQMVESTIPETQLHMGRLQ